jgi:hypothetical protein
MATSPADATPSTDKATSPVAKAAYTIAEFCEAHSISPSTYRNIRLAGRGPDEMHGIGATVRISVEAAARWREAMEHAPKGPHKRGEAARAARRALSVRGRVP